MNNQQIPVSDIENNPANLDRAVDPPQMRRGLIGKTSGGSYLVVACTSGGYITPNV